MANGTGVNRPMNLIDVLRTIYDQSGAATQAVTGSVTGVGVVAEANETLASADAASTFVALPPGWDAQVWGGLAWG